MGGCLKVVIRKENGEILTMRRWTNSLSSLLKNKQCYQSTESEAFKSYMKPFYDMKNDFEKNKDSGQYKLNMTEIYFKEGYDKVIPEDYGIVILDFITKNLISCQGYTGPKANLFFRYKYKDINDLEIEIMDDLGSFADEDLALLIKNKNFTTVGFPESYLEYLSIQSRPVSLKEVETLQEFNDILVCLAKDAAKQNKDILKVSFFSLDVDINGFNYFHDEDIQKAQDKLSEIGFPLTGEELNGWERYKKRFEEE